MEQVVIHPDFPRVGNSAFHPANRRSSSRGRICEHSIRTVALRSAFSFATNPTRQMHTRLTALTLLYVVVACSLTGCSTWGYKSRVGDKVYPPVPYQHVQVLTYWPAQPFTQIGICSVSGGAFATGVDMYRKLQKSAAALGADAVVITGEGSSLAVLPGYATTTGNAYGVGRATYNPATRTATGVAYATGQSTTIYMPPSTFSLPNNRGIAIKFSR